MRKQLLNIFLPLLAIFLVAAAGAQDTSTAPKRAALLKVAVVPGADGMNLELTTRGQVAPKLTTLDSPARVVVDLPGTIAVNSQTIQVDNDGVKRVRVAMDGQKPPTARVVVDLDQACSYEIASSGNDKLVLKLHTSAARAKNDAKSIAPAMAPKPSVAAAVPAISSPVVKTMAAVNTPSQTSSANSFVFLEPSYKPKTETSVAEDHSSVTPVPARSLAAAARFVEKPDSDLLPTPSAAMAEQDSSSSPTPAVNLAAEQKTQMKQPVSVVGPKYTGEPISVNLKDVDLKDFFRLIHEISGLNVVLDPNVQGTLTLVLDDVPWDQALDIVLKNNGLARQLEGNVLRIATVDTLRKEAEVAPRRGGSAGSGGREITVTRYPELCAREGRGAYHQEVPHPARRASSPTTAPMRSSSGHSCSDSGDRPADQAIGPQDAAGGDRGACSGGNPQLRPRHRHSARLRLGQERSEQR